MLGVEFGMLYALLLSDHLPLRTIHHIDNEEQILLAANRLGYVIEEKTILDDTWFELQIRHKSAFE